MTLEEKIQWLMDRPKVWMEVDSREEMNQIGNTMVLMGFKCDYWMDYEGQRYIKVFIT